MRTQPRQTKPSVGYLSAQADTNHISRGYSSLNYSQLFSSMTQTRWRLLWATRLVPASALRKFKIVCHSSAVVAKLSFGLCLSNIFVPQRLRAYEYVSNHVVGIQQSTHIRGYNMNASNVFRRILPFTKRPTDRQLSLKQENDDNLRERI